jgi:hypothetical protein
MSPLPRTEKEIDAFLAAFEAGALPKERWTHAAHILTGACYVHAVGEAVAIDTMRLRVSRYNEAVGGRNTDTSGYHETITIGWIKLLRNLLHESGPIGRAPFAARAVERYANNRSALAAYYDFDLPGSVEARRAWVPPTRGSLD